MHHTFNEWLTKKLCAEIDVLFSGLCGAVRCQKSRSHFSLLYHLREMMSEEDQLLIATVCISANTLDPDQGLAHHEILIIQL